MNTVLFAKRMAVLREARGLGVTEFAERVGVSREQVWHWERGTKGISGRNMERVCEVLGVTMAEFWDPDFLPDEQNELPVGDEWPDRAIGELPAVREDQRAKVCPRCKTGGYSDTARYCPLCGFSLYNVCATPERHVNAPDARFCERCGQRTLWGMSAEELEKIGVPMPRPENRTPHNSESVPGRS